MPRGSFLFWRARLRADAGGTVPGAKRRLPLGHPSRRLLLSGAQGASVWSFPGCIVRTRPGLRYPPPFASTCPARDQGTALRQRGRVFPLACLLSAADSPSIPSRNIVPAYIPCVVPQPCRSPSTILFPLPGPSLRLHFPPCSSRAKDCALNQHFSSHLGTFVQRKIIL